ncbi:kinase-like domain-containing protein [Gigaspora rosea]|uniref:Kinase-like domain-containing protein n=1 Tax=Gigaspora rosea TaxID=44941 RepID=A0A397UW23_9GLOM|nr:kinase-like domain-containing protein [Gigaspora rosea]
MMIGGFCFGISKDVSLSRSITMKMQAYIEPQCFREPSYKRDMKSDIYSLGVILWEISSGRPPFQHFESKYSISNRIFQGEREAPVEGTPPQYMELYMKCWDYSPAKRPDTNLILDTLDQLLRHKVPVITEARTDPSTYIQWNPSIYIKLIEDAISQQLINCFDYSEFIDHEKIGDGRFSTVVKSEWKSCGLTVALKCLKFDTKKEMEGLFVKELQRLQRVSFHPKVNHFYGVTKDFYGNYKMILQFANDGNLRDYLVRNFSTLRWKDKFRIAGEIAQGLVFLHGNNIIHKNLHPKNILVLDNKMMLTDFGFSKVLTVDMSSSTSNMDGMPAFIDPQCFKKIDYRRTIKSDIYSFGVILWEISSGHKPFPKLTRIQIAIQIFNDKREKPVEGTPPQYEDLYKRCWDVDPDKRPEINDAFNLLNQFILKPAELEFRENIEEPLKGSLKQAALDHIIKFHNYNEFSEIRKIAEEPFSSIYKCEWRQHGLIIVLKCLKVNDEFLNKNNVKVFIEMLQILQKFNHPNIVKFYGITKVAIIVRFYNGQMKGIYVIILKRNFPHLTGPENYVWLKKYQKDSVISTKMVLLMVNYILKIFWFTKKE